MGISQYRRRRRVSNIWYRYRPIPSEKRDMGRWFSKPVAELPNPKSRVVQPESPNSERMKSKRESAECRAFRRCFSVLADGISDPGRLAIQLYSRELIGSDLRTEAQKPTARERVKIEELLSAVENTLCLVQPASSESLLMFFEVSHPFSTWQQS